MKRSEFLLASLMLPFTALRAAEPTYPQRPVRIVVPFSAGAAADAVVRPLAARLSQYWGMQVIVENKPGMTHGPQSVSTAEPDGYTLLMGATSNMVTAPLVAGTKLPYNTRRDFVPITRLVTLSPMLVAHPSLGVKTFKEFVAYVKARPGKLNYSSSGTGTPNHLGMEYLMDLTGLDMVHIPYKGAAPAVVDMISNQVQTGFNTIPSVLSHIRAGRLVPIGVGSPNRSATLPDVPSIAETIPGFDLNAWYGLFAPTGTPPAVLQKVRTDVQRALKEPDLVKLLVSEGSEPAPSTAAELTKLIDHETQVWSKLIKDRNLKLD